MELSSIEHKQRRTLSDAEVVFRQGDLGSEMYVVYSGKVRIFRSDDGRQTELATLGPGEFFGEMALFDDRPRSASAQAVGDTELRVIGKEAFDQMASDPVIRELLTTLATRLRAMDDAFQRLSVESESRREFMSERLLGQRQWLT